MKKTLGTSAAVLVAAAITAPTVFANNRYDMHVTVCGPVGPDSNYQVLSELKGAPRFNHFFKEKDMHLEVVSFNGHDHSMAAPRKRQWIKAGETKTYKCNSHKGGCKFRVKLTDPGSTYESADVEGVAYPNVYFNVPIHESVGSTAHKMAIKIEKALGAPGIANKCNALSNTTMGCTYAFQEWKVGTYMNEDC